MRIRKSVVDTLNYGLAKLNGIAGFDFVNYLYLFVNDANNHCCNDHRCVVSLGNETNEVALNEIVMKVPQLDYSYQQLFTPAGSVVSVDGESIEKLKKDTIFHYCCEK